MHHQGSYQSLRRSKTTRATSLYTREASLYFPLPVLRRGLACLQQVTPHPSRRPSAVPPSPQGEGIISALPPGRLYCAAGYQICICQDMRLTNTPRPADFAAAKRRNRRKAENCRRESSECNERFPDSVLPLKGKASPMLYTRTPCAAGYKKSSHSCASSGMLIFYPYLRSRSVPRNDNRKTDDLLRK